MAETGEGGHGGQLQNCLSCVEMAVGRGVHRLIHDCQNNV